MRTVLVLATISLFALALLVGCAKPPTEQMNAAQTAIQDAQTAQADIYAPDLFSQAKQAFDQGNNQVTEKDYPGALQSFTTAAQKAAEAKDAVPKRKEEIKAKIMAQKGEIDKQVAEYEKKFKGAKKLNKEQKAQITADFDAVKADLAKLEGEATANPMNAAKMVEGINAKIKGIDGILAAAAAPAPKVDKKASGKASAVPKKK